MSENKTKNYLNIQQQLLQSIRLILRNNNIDINTFFSNPNPNNKKANMQILTAMSREYINDEESYNLLCVNYNYLNEKLHKGEKDTEDYKLAKILRAYDYDMIGQFFRFENGEVVLTGAENFEMPSYDNPKSFLTKSEVKEEAKRDGQYITSRMAKKKANPTQLELLILPDGKTYFAPKDHLTLANWLNATGVDIKGAVRLEATKHAYGKSSFDVTSLYNYKFSESSNMDEQIALTDKQGEALAKVYGGLQSAWENLANFEEVLYMSTGFGLGKKDEKYDANIAKNNLKILRNYVDEDYFDVKAYKQTMSSGSDPHSPLS